jgi:uncharacterized protein (DUF1778 family)
MARPKKAARDRRTENMKLPMTRDEKRAIEEAAESVGAKPVTFAREAALRAARRVK